MYRIGYGEDIHRLVRERKLILGGIVIPHEFGLLGHSDADVVLHALSEAIFGALAAGDLGTHFPSDEANKDLDSAIILKKADELMRQEGYQIANIDLSIALEKPRLAPYILMMRVNIASILSTDLKNISIKAMTNEGLDAIGRQEACRATAVVLLRRK
ncbi:MAG: 2-C-methyl-D-erythritol 2,4-cyclodiphosphate synthase [Bacilli bacterium]|jgi:2-C-methyl-D-erythritol 2,4-cyclodiphosphate synthase